MTGIPQYDALRDLRAVVALVSLGLGDNSTVNRVIGGTERQARYALSAARGLGLIEPDSTSSAWVRTALGAKLNRRSAYQAYRMLAYLARDTPLQKALAAGPEKAVELIVASGYTGTTVRRRLVTAYSWAEDIADILGDARPALPSPKLAQALGGPLGLPPRPGDAGAPRIGFDGKAIGATPTPKLDPYGDDIRSASGDDDD